MHALYFKMSISVSELYQQFVNASFYPVGS